MGKYLLGDGISKLTKFFEFSQLSLPEAVSTKERAIRKSILVTNPDIAAWVVKH